MKGELSVFLIHNVKPKVLFQFLALLLSSKAIANSPVTPTDTSPVGTIPKVAPLSTDLSKKVEPVILSLNSQKPKQSTTDYSDFGGANTQEDSHDMWLALREQYFSDRPIIETDAGRILLQAPSRAENDALVPVLINLETMEKDFNDPFTKVYLVVDVNPLPMGGVFKLAKNRPMEQLKTSVRVNGYTYVRAIAETASGKLYMAKQWVKSTGAGCSAPPGVDQDMHKSRLGKMRFKQMANQDNKKNSRVLRLMISHPNNTGMQKDQLTTLFIPEHYVKHVNVTFNKDLVLEADINFTLSENPNFTFSFDPEESGILKANMTDNQDNFFSLETEIKGR